MADLNTLSWFKKYQPTTIDEYVFENEQQKSQITEWMENGILPGNLLLYGTAGTGKSALAHLLIRSIIKSKYDVEKVKDKGVAAIDELHNWCQKQPVSSKQKIVYIEELDRASIQAFNSLKDGLMENYQPHVAFICTTNFLNRIEYAVQTRFNFTFNLNCSNLAGIYTRLSDILTKENITYTVDELKAFIETNHSIGLRNMINLLQINRKSDIIDFENMRNIKSEQEEELVKIVLEILNKVRSESNFNIKITMANLPLQTPIAQLYSSLLELINYNNDINYNTVFLELFNKVHGLPYLTIIDKYIHEIEYKKFQNLHFIAFLYEMIKCCIETGI